MTTLQPLVGLPTPFHGTFIGETGTTMDDLVAALERGAEHGYIVQAGCQTNGRGSNGRHWSSIKGNLMFSFLTNYGADISAREISFIVALALGQAIYEALPAGKTIRYKWPNDIFINGNSKLGGILVENTSKKAFKNVGIGINVLTTPDISAMRDDVTYSPTSLRDQGGYITAAELLNTFCSKYLQIEADWRRYGIFRIFEKLGFVQPGSRYVRAVTRDGVLFTGRLTAIRGDNVILSRHNGREQALPCADIVLQPAYSPSTRVLEQCL